MQPHPSSPYRTTTSSALLASTLACTPSLSTKQTPTRTATRPTPLRRLSLHLLRHLDIDFKELRHAAIQAHRLALVQVVFAVLGRDALFRARVD